jgi:hypothetical protein
MATSLETRTVPVTVSFLVETTLQTTRTDTVIKKRWFMPEARAAVKQNIMVIQAKDQNRGLVI